MSVYRFDRAARAERLLITLARRGAPQAERDRQAALHFGQSAAALLASLPPQAAQRVRAAEEKERKITDG